MHEDSKKRTLKTLALDLFMGLNFVFLLVVAVWIVWVYYFRGPIDIVTGKTKSPEQDLLVEARSEYTKQFHNLDLVVAKGIQTGSLCVDCHGDYAHYKSQKIRSLLNAHSWFVACEVCHIKAEAGTVVVYRWLDNKTGHELTALTGANGDYGATIAPLKIEGGKTIRLDRTEDDFIREYLQTKGKLNETQKKDAEKKMHEPLTKEPVYCDQCHTEKGLFKFTDLLYSPQSAKYLETLDMGAMAKTYKEFHFPSLFDQ